MSPSTPKREICERYGISWPGLWKYMRENGLPVRGFDASRKNLANFSFFHKIDTEEKAYWLLFIYADGCIHRNSKTDKEPFRLSLQLSEHDREHLERFSRSLGSTYPISDFTPVNSSYAHTPMSRLTINSVELVRDLMTHGVIERKQFTPHHFPIGSIPRRLLPDAIRGLADGDGAISVYPARQTRHSTQDWRDRTGLRDTVYEHLKGEFNITGDRTLLTDVKQILVDEICISDTKIKTYAGKEAVSIRWSGYEDLQKVYHYLYKEATIFLPRKRNEFDRLISERIGLSLQAAWGLRRA